MALPDQDQLVGKERGCVSFGILVWWWWVGSSFDVMMREGRAYEVCHFSVVPDKPSMAKHWLPELAELSPQRLL